MISTACYPYPVDANKASTRAVLQPHIYSPSVPHHSPGGAMYPHFHATGCSSPTYVYAGYEQYYSKDAWPAAAPPSWPTFYPVPPRSSSLPQSAINPRVTIIPLQPVLVSDIDTPSSISSHSVLTPSSPFAQHDMGESELHPMEFDEFDCEDEDYIDSDFADEMDGIDEAPSPFYGASAPHAVKSTSALAGALGDAPLSYHATDMNALAPADRKLSASVPGYASVSRRSTAPASRQRSPERADSPLALHPLHVPDVSYPSHIYTHHDYAPSPSSTSLLAPPSPVLYNHISASSSLAGAFSTSAPASFSRASRHASHPLPILQPQPIRPIPPIPLADLTSSANESSRSPAPHAHPSQTLSPLPLLCRPVSDAVRYQFKEPPAGDSGALANEDARSYDQANGPVAVCEDVITVDDRFGPSARDGMAFCSEHHPRAGATGCSVEQKLFAGGCIALPVQIRWE